jgi:hypothetical protein
MTEVQRPAASTVEIASGEGEYRPITPWAVIALVLAVASATAFAGPLLWFLPVLGVVAAGIALRQTSAPDAEVTGRRLATWALALSLLLGVGAVVDRIATDWRLKSEANQFTMLWFDHLREGHPERAHQLTLAPHRRRATEDLVSYYHSQPEAHAELDQFIADSVVREILNAGQRATAELEQTETLRKDERGRIYISQLYRIAVPGDSDEIVRYLAVLTQRTVDPDTRDVHWQIYRSKEQPKPRR